MHEECKKYADRISEFLNGELDGAAREEIEQHLCDCPECRECVESLRKTVDVLKRTPMEEVPTDTKQRLREALKACLTQGKPNGNDA